MLTLIKACVKITYVNKKSEVIKMMDKNELMEKLDEMVAILGAETVLEELARAMSSDELQDNLEYVDRMQETELFN